VSRLPSNPFRKPKRDDDPFADFFADFEKEFARMQTYMNSLMEEALKNAEIPKGENRPGNPFVYGFSLRIGPDGKPQIEQFGNTPRPSPEIAVEGGREPITDLIQHPEHYSVTVELPGVEKEDIQVWVADQRLTIKVDTAARRYYKEIDLPGPVKSDTTDATFKNGVLDVTVKRDQPRQAPAGTRVNVK
jgi:HSP20 family protein